MHVPSHSAALPAGVDPIPMPDTRREAGTLLILLDAGLYPRMQSRPAPSEAQPSGTEENGRFRRSTESLRGSFAREHAPDEPTVEDPLPIQAVGLPTYAPWLNPIGKLWRYLKQEVVHLHQKAEDFPSLHSQVDALLDRFAGGSEHLLRYVGLLLS